MIKILIENVKAYYQKTSYSIKLKSFYQYDDNKDSGFPSLLSKILNLIFSKMALFTIVYLWFVYRIKKPFIAIVLSIIFVSLLSIALYFKRKGKFIKKRNEKRRLIAEKYIIQKMKLLNNEEFKWQMMKLLLKLPGISHIKSHTRYLESMYKGSKAAIGYYNVRYSGEVSPSIRRLESFIRWAKREGFPQALFITTGEYDDECKELAEKKSTIKVHLLDKNHLLQLMEKSSMYPGDEIIDSLIYKEISKRRKNYSEFKSEILTPKRIKTYLGYSIFFMVLSGIFKLYSIYYIAISILFLLLSMVTYFQNRNEVEEPEEAKIIIDSLTSQDTAIQNKNNIQ